MKRIVSPSGMWDLAKGHRSPRRAHRGRLFVVPYAAREADGIGNAPNRNDARAHLLGAVLAVVAYVGVRCTLLDRAHRLRLPAPAIQRVDQDDQARGTRGTARGRRKLRSPPRTATAAKAPHPYADPRGSQPGRCDSRQSDTRRRRDRLRQEHADARPCASPAKAEEEMALILRQEAIARGVPVIENPPIARAIHSACDVGEEIPPALYETVARLLAFVYRLSPTASALLGRTSTTRRSHGERSQSSYRTRAQLREADSVVRTMEPGWPRSGHGSTPLCCGDRTRAPLEGL